ncbi:MAG: hypothetical protein IJ662_06195 [Clostridia bacterium]|nr:hypothetical protein [Clostridia bacterium]
MRAVRWIVALMLCALLPLIGWGEEGPAAQEDRIALRALLVGCDHFQSQPDTWPAASRNVEMLSEALMRDERDYALIRSYADGLSSVEQLYLAVLEAFGDAQEGDVSLLYIGTHGVFDEGGSNAGAALILSDGEGEELLYAPMLEDILDAIPGQKVVILDACNSGAFIGKGLSGGADRIFFSGPDYKVLCSAGGSEASWYFQSTQETSAAGASYFATVLADGLGSGGDFAADVNADGRITLKEVYAYLTENYAASTPQVYPQNDGDFVLFAYDADAERAIGKAVTDITFEDTLLTAGESSVAFSLTVRRQVELYYQIVYHENGAWQFEQAQHFLDGEQPDGTVLPGRKIRTLALNTVGEDAYGYAIIQLITLEEGRPVLQGARLLCVQPDVGPVSLNVATDPAFVPGLGQELCILAQHDVPCGLTVNILDADGQLVRRLAYETPSRPQQLSPNASSFYWDGRSNGGDMAPPGLYTVQLRVRLGDSLYVRESAPVELLSLAEAEALEAVEAVDMQEADTQGE